MNTFTKESGVNVHCCSAGGHPAGARMSSVLFAMAVVVAVSFGIAPDTGAANLACKPDIEVTNLNDKAIKVLRFQYKDGGGGNHTEGLGNKKLSPGETETWKSQKLQDVAEGNRIQEIRVEYRNDASGQSEPISDPWGPAEWTAWFPQTGDCKDYTDYHIKVREKSDLPQHP